MQYTYQARVVKIIDGDTIRADIYLQSEKEDLGFNVWREERIVYKNQTIRFYGINTPETRTRDLEEKKKGLEAKQEVIEFLESCGMWCQVYSREKGKYGRVLGVIFRRECQDYTLADDNPLHYKQSLNYKLIESGHATEYFGGKK